MILPQHALVIGVFAFYLYDALMSFYGDEILLEGAGSRWNVIARTGWLASGRYLHIPSPFAPYRMIFKGTWPATTGSDIPTFARRRASVFLSAIAPLQWLSALLAVQLLVALPLFVAFRRQDWLVLLAATVYLSALLAAATVFYRRRAFGLSRRACWAIAFDLVSCPPFAINAVRKICLRQPASDFGAFIHSTPGGMTRQLARASSERACLLALDGDDEQGTKTREPAPHD